MKRASLALFAALAACGQAPAPRSERSNDSAPTYYQDVRPILDARCTACHKPGEIAPFPLLTYADALPNAADIAKATEERRMPPFPPDTTSCRPLDDPRLMTDSERDILQRWVNAGAPEGDSSRPAPDLPAAAELLGEPTDAFSTGVDYTPAPPVGEQDDYHCFVIDPKLTAAIPYHAVDVAASNRAIAHHASVYLATKPASVAAARALDDAAPGPGYMCFGDTLVDDVDEIGGWVPGQPPQAYPAGTGSFIPPGSVFVLQMHYNIATTSGVDRSSIRLWRPAQPFPQVPSGFDVENYDFRIPPHAENVSAAGTTLVVPAGSEATDTQANEGLLWQVGLHEHLLGTAIRMDLVHADGSEECLLDIPRWQFGWQGSYNFVSPVRLVPNDNIRVTCTWNNTTDRTIRYGNASSDEMCQGWGITTR
jgi:hypothetical protein